jgi:hypothetical protein
LGSVTWLREKMEKVNGDLNELSASLKLAWRELSVPSVEDVRGLEYEFGDYFMECFAGRSIDTVDRGEVACLAGMALVFMKPNASAYYLCVYLILVVETLPVRIRGDFTLDFVVLAQTYIALGDEQFAREVCIKHLSSMHLELVVRFIVLSIRHRQELELDLEDARKLSAVCEILKSVINEA